MTTLEQVALAIEKCPIASQHKDFYIDQAKAAIQALIDADWAVKCSGLEDYKAKASACFLAKAMLKQILEEK